MSILIFKIHDNNSNDKLFLFYLDIMLKILKLN